MRQWPMLKKPHHNDLSNYEKKYAFFTDGSCCLVGSQQRYKAAIWIPTWRVAEVRDRGELLQFMKVKVIQLALEIAVWEK